MTQGARRSGGGASNGSYDADVVMFLVVVLRPMYAGLYFALEASVNSICIIRSSTLVAVSIVTRTTTEVGTDCNESTTTPFGHGIPSRDAVWVGLAKAEVHGPRSKCRSTHG